MRRRGFTLLEMLIALALATALLAAMFAFFWDLLATRQRIIEETARRRAVETLVESLERDLLTALVGDRVHGAGIAGDETSISVLSRAVPARLAEQSGNLGFADLERSQYRFDPWTHTLSAQRQAVQNRGRGVRDLVRPAPLGGIVHRVRFRFHDGQDWRESFDSVRAGSLPLAVEVAVWFDPTAEEVLAAEFADPIEEDDEPFMPADRLNGDEDEPFDERAFAIESDLDLLDEPRPDRVRVIGLADARPPADEEVSR